MQIPFCGVISGNRNQFTENACKLMIIESSNANKPRCQMLRISITLQMQGNIRWAFSEALIDEVFTSCLNRQCLTVIATLLVKERRRWTRHFEDVKRASRESVRNEKKATLIQPKL